MNRAMPVIKGLGMGWNGWQSDLSPVTAFEMPA